MLDLNLNLNLNHNGKQFLELSNSSLVGDEENTNREYAFDMLRWSNLEDEQLLPEFDGGYGGRPVEYSQQVKKRRRGPRSRSSQYRGVCITGEQDDGNHIFGGFDTAHYVARAYDQAAIRFRGLDTDINFIVNDYQQDLNLMKNLTKDEFHVLRRLSTGSVRGSSKYRGVFHYTNVVDRKLEWGNFLERNTYTLDCLSVKLKLQVNIQSMDLNLGIVLLPYLSQVVIMHFIYEDGRTRIDPSAFMTLASQVPIPNRGSGTSRFFPVYQGTSIERSKEVNSSLNWPCQVHGTYGGFIPTSLFSAAASSGFGSSIITASASAAAHHHYNPPIRTPTYHYTMS